MFRRSITLGLALSAAVVALSAFTGAAALAAPDDGSIRGANVDGAIKDNYIVVFKSGSAAARTVDSSAAGLARSYGAKVRHSYSTAVRGFSARLTEAAAKRLAANPAVDYVEQDRAVTLAGTQTNPTWGLDRIDQTALPLNTTYTYPNTASNVHAYILDTGVRISHSDFGGRAANGYDFVDNDAVAQDCNGHGTHVAGTVGGSTYGVAKSVQLVAVRVLDCTGSGTYSQLIAGIDWVTANAVKPAVANMSLGGPAGSVLDNAVKASINSGVTYAVAAGNENVDACTTSPARLVEAITVGATNSSDARASFSNYGTCLDLFAPGVSITSASSASDSGSTLMSGTSMATPHVVGVAALYLAANPTHTPTQVREALVTAASSGRVSGAGTGSPNLLLKVDQSAAAVPTVTMKAAVNNRFVSADGGGARALIANGAAAGAWEQFTVVDNGDGTVGILAAVNGRFVSAESAGTKPLIANRTSVGAWERFTKVTNGDGTVSFRASVNNRYVSAESAGAQSLIANRTGIGAWERFAVSGETVEPPPADTATQTVSVRARVNNRYVTAGSAPLIANKVAVGAAEQFAVADNGDGTVGLLSVATDRYVTAESAGTRPLIANRDSVGAWERFTVVTNTDGSVSFRAAVNNRYVTAENAGAGALIANRTAIGAWERFDMSSVTEPHGSMTNAQFIAASVPGAQESQVEHRVPASVTLAQAILESGWGRSALSYYDKNFFGMKCFSQGTYANGCRNHNTNECTPQGSCFATAASFRTYASAINSFRDHGSLLATNSRYRKAFDNVGEPDKFVAEMHKAGYATDPQYTQKLTALMAKYNLYQYDLR
jgi:subtilisin family serine protease